MMYKFYKAQVTGNGNVPDGHCQATLTLDNNRQPTWSDVSEEFQRVCLPWFDNTVRLGVMDKIEPLKPYSEEAIDHLSKRQLPSQGFMMMNIKEEVGPKILPQTFGYPQGSYLPPPGLFKKDPPK